MYTQGMEARLLVNQELQKLSPADQADHAECSTGPLPNM
jgi:hypothetical protein